MNEIFYYVYPNGTIDPIPIIKTATVNSAEVPPSAPTTTLYNLVHNPDAGLYSAIVDTNPIPAYHDHTSTDLSLTGPVGEQATRVQQTKQFAPWDIEDLYDEKQLEIDLHDAEVRYGYAQSSAQTNWWLVVNERARAELGSNDANLNSLWRQGLNYPVGQDAPMAWIYNVVTGVTKRYRIGAESDWHITIADWALHDRTTGNATEASESALDATYANGNGDWQAVADHDPNDAAWGYPTQPPPPVAQGRGRGRGRGRGGQP